MPAASFGTPGAAPSMGLTRAPVASARSMSRSVSRGSGVTGSPPASTSASAYKAPSAPTAPV
jgi:hypothetical protein